MNVGFIGICEQCEVHCCAQPVAGGDLVCMHCHVQGVHLLACQGRAPHALCASSSRCSSLAAEIGSLSEVQFSLQASS